MTNLRWCLVAQVLGATTCFAHPGHETLPVEPSTAWHYLFEPMHAVPALSVGALIILAALAARAYFTRRLAVKR